MSLLTGNTGLYEGQTNLIAFSNQLLITLYNENPKYTKQTFLGMPVKSHIDTTLHLQQGQFKPS